MMKPFYLSAPFEPLFSFYAEEIKGVAGETALHWHNCHEFAQLVEGTAVLTIDGTSHILKKHDIVSIGLGVLHRVFDYSANAVLRVFLAGVDIFGESTDDITQRTRRESVHSKKVFNAAKDGSPIINIARLLDEIFDEYTRKETGWRFMVRDKLLEMEASYFRFFSPDGEMKQKSHKIKQNERLERCLDYIHQHFYDPEFTIEEAAAATLLSESRFIRFFHEQSGQYFSDYLANLRLAHAKKQLCGSDKPIAAIAGDSGFNSLATFNRLFKKHTGLSPRSFRTTT
jgi:AraC-like DNA-binding protein